MTDQDLFHTSSSNKKMHAPSDQRAGMGEWGSTCAHVCMYVREGESDGKYQETRRASEAGIPVYGTYLPNLHNLPTYVRTFSALVRTHGCPPRRQPARMEQLLRDERHILPTSRLYPVLSPLEGPILRHPGMTLDWPCLALQSDHFWLFTKGRNDGFRVTHRSDGACK
jgi:hypothetical protein